MFKFINYLGMKPKKPIVECTHKYELLKKVEREVQYGNGYMDSMTVEDVFIYCPKCRSREKVNPLEWELIQKEQVIDTKYMKKHEVVSL